MGDSGIIPRHAWQPLTPRGVAAFAAASAGRLWLVQLIVASFVAAMTVAFVETNWFPVARSAVERLPATNAVIYSGRLHWGAETPTRLAENRFIALLVDVKNTRELGRIAEVEISLHGTNVSVASLLGEVTLAYPTAWSLNLTRSEAIPWWGAWEWPILALTALTMGVFLMVSWFCLGTLYCPFVRAFAFFANRKLDWRASWKLSGAALMPGALVQALGAFIYGWLGMDLFRLGLFFLLHMVTGWIFIAVSPFFLPRDPGAGAVSANPFAAPNPDGKKTEPRKNNPFASGS